MTIVVAAVAWGTLATAAWAHGRAPNRFTDLLSVHFVHRDRASLVARLVIAIEVLLSVGAVVGYFAQLRAVLFMVGLAGALVGAGYTAWVTMLVVDKSGLPCACSFSSAPPTWWSVARAVVICGFGAFIAAPGLPVVGVSTAAALFVAAAGLGTAIYTLPEAMSWPSPARELRRQSTHVAASGAAGGADR